MNAVRRLYVVTHRDPAVAGRAVGVLCDTAERVGIELVADPVESEKHPRLADACRIVDESGGSAAAGGCDAAIVLAGDGTLLRTLAQLGPETPVLGVNFGMLGFLSGASHDSLEHAIESLAAGSYRTRELPGLELDLAGRGSATAVNDVVATGGITGRVNELAWRIVSDEGHFIDEMGTVACDGMVMATPVGSTAYNLSNGGPVLAWGVKGTVVSFVAPHTLAARPLVVAPDDTIEVQHMGRGAPLKVLADGVQVGRLQPGEVLRVRRGGARATLAFTDETSFYARYRDNFAVQMTFHGPRVRASDRKLEAPAESAGQEEAAP
ncbi:MAG: NAD(+)/NADH kinase [Thermoleophilia bacterium]|nr:NAD(+)/NADH kinase [Thermoleophilia bacterium]